MAYISHRSIHLPCLYWIHKKHHEYNKIFIPMVGAYSSPVEFIVNNAIPNVIGIKILASFTDVHIITITIWIIFRVIESCEGHCGYEWPWAQLNILPFSAGTNYHYFHHTNYVCNYGAILTLYDSLFDTNEEYSEKL